MLNIGITGGIGSGKTTICRIFEAIGIPIYYADDRAKKLMVEDELLVTGIQQVFGEGITIPSTGEAEDKAGRQTGFHQAISSCINHLFLFITILNKNNLL